MALADFSIYKALKLSEIQSNSALSTTVQNVTTVITTGASNVIAQSCTREGFMKVANIQATATEATVAEGRVASFQSYLRTANVTSTSANSAASTSAYTVVQLWKHTIANSSGLVVSLAATANLYNVALTEWQPVPFVINTGTNSNIANAVFLPGDVLTCNTTATSTGSATATTVTVDYCLEDI
jgi:hypothetical protein